MDSLKGSGKTLTVNDFQSIEALYGAIPEEIKQFYIHNNGGSSNKKNFVDLLGCENEIECFLSFTKGNRTYKKSIEEFYSIFVNDWKAPKNLLPFARNSGGDFYCFNSTTNKIVLFFNDPDEGEPRTVSDDFATFIKLLNLK